MYALYCSRVQGTVLYYQALWPGRELNPVPLCYKQSALTDELQGQRDRQALVPVELQGIRMMVVVDAEPASVES